MSRKLGQDVEEKAANYLKRQGVKIIERNYQIRGGEIDLIGTQKNILVFIEVRYRKTDHFGGAEESVTLSKQRRILMTAEHFLMNNPKLQNLCCRFDVIACNPVQKDFSMNWIKGAFTA